MGNELKEIISIRLPRGLEISDQQIERLVAETKETSQAILNGMGIWNVMPHFTLGNVETYDTIIPKSDADPYLSALSLPDSKSIIGQPANIELDDFGKDPPYQICCLTKDFTIIRGIGLRLFFQNPPVITHKCQIYCLEFLEHKAAKGSALVELGSWAALVKNYETDKETGWRAKITFP